MAVSGRSYKEYSVISSQFSFFAVTEMVIIPPDFLSSLSMLVEENIYIYILVAPTNALELISASSSCHQLSQLIHASYGSHFPY